MSGLGAYPAPSPHHSPKSHLSCPIWPTRFQHLISFPSDRVKNQKAKVSTFEKFSPCAGVNFKSQVGNDTGFIRPPTKQPPPPHLPPWEYQQETPVRMGAGPRSRCRCAPENKEGLEQETFQGWGTDRRKEGLELRHERANQGVVQPPLPLSPTDRCFSTHTTRRPEAQGKERQHHHVSDMPCVQSCWI